MEEENINLDEWLNSISTPIPTEIPGESAIVSQQPSESDFDSGVITSSEPQSLSEQDFADILQVSGYNASEPADAEEIHDGSDDEGVLEEEEMPVPMDIDSLYNENIGEGRDLDAEEDADWQEAIDSGGIVPTSIGNEDIEATTPSELSEGQLPDGQLLPENSPTLSIDDTTSRFSGAEWYDEVRSKSVTFAGLGGIGSWSSLLIGRMGLQTFSLYDDDKVEFANMSGQLFSRKRVDEYKVEAMRELLGEYTSVYSVFCNRRRFTEISPTSDVMICGFDNMEARKTFFNAWKEHLRTLSPEQKNHCLYIDGRLSMDTLQVFCIQGNDRINMARYEEEFLFDDAEADETICSMKQTSYLAAMIGAVITNLFTNWCANLVDPIVPYDLPFFTEYNAQHMIFKTEH